MVQSSVSANLFHRAEESFNQVVTPIAYPLLYFPLRTGMSMSEWEESDAGMSPMPE
jgi:hypothetical protein